MKALGCIPKSQDSGAARYDCVQALLNGEAERVNRRKQLDRQPSTTNSELDEIAMKNLPVATEVPPMLAQALEREVGSQQTVPKMPMVVTDGILDASAVNPDFKIPAKLEFEDVCPATLALAARCAQDGVFAAPSIMFPGATGLYPATDFKTGDVVARVEPLSHKWVSIDDPSLEEDTGFRRVEIDLEFCKKKGSSASEILPDTLGQTSA